MARKLPQASVARAPGVRQTDRMVIAEMPKWLRRFGRGESSRLALAFALSLAFHLLVTGGYYAGKKLGWWQRLHTMQWMRSTPMITQLFRKEPPKPKQLPPPSEIPLVFVEVDPAQATVEPPRDAKFYSSQNSQAANPEPDQPEADMPKITGEQQQVVKTVDVEREKFVPLQPTIPAPRTPEEQEELKPKAPEPKGDLALARPDPVPPKDPGQETRARPRTIKEALARKTPTQIPGQKMKQDGGVRRKLEIASLDAKATPFGAYDAMLIEAISQRWYALLDQRDYASDSRGKVVLQFRLHPDGRISAMNVAENSAGEVLGLICQKAVLDPAPYSPWPMEMRRLMGDTRSIQFTFYYN